MSVITALLEFCKDDAVFIQNKGHREVFIKACDVIIEEAGVASSITIETARKIGNLLSFLDSIAHNRSVAKNLREKTEMIKNEGARDPIQRKFDSIIAETEDAHGVNPNIRKRIHEAIGDLHSNLKK